MMPPTRGESGFRPSCRAAPVIPWVEGVVVAAGEMSVVQRWSHHNPEQTGAGLCRLHYRHPPPPQDQSTSLHVADVGHGLGVTI